MTTSTFFRLAGVTLLALVILLSAGSPSLAETPPDFVLDFEAGQACDFALQVEIRGGNQVYKEFFDKNGKIVRSLSAGAGSALTFINTETNAALALKSNGSVTHITYREDGSQEWITTGHNVLILFPSDIPAGPSTTQYVGRVVFTVDASGIFTLQSVSGRATDICAALSTPD